MTGDSSLAYRPSVTPPLDEIEIELRHPRDRRKRSKPYLVVSLDCLETILLAEDSVIAAEDVPGLLAALCGYAIRADVSDHGLAAEMQARYEDQADDQAEARADN